MKMGNVMDEKAVGSCINLDTNKCVEYQIPSVFEYDCLTVTLTTLLLYECTYALL